MYLTPELYEQNNYKIENCDIWHAVQCIYYTHICLLQHVLLNQEI